MHYNNIFKTTSRIAALLRSGFTNQARKLFDEMPHRDTIAWNSIISSYSHLGHHQESLFLFHRMRISNNTPDHFTFTATLNACAASTSLCVGNKLHALVIVLGYQSSVPVNNSLIDMYGKCYDSFSAGKVFGEMKSVNQVTWCSLLFAYANSGCFDAAFQVFHSLPERIDVAWNIMVACLGHYEEIELCLDVYRVMRENLCEPDQWTYSALVSACAESSKFFFGRVIHAIILKSGWGAAAEVNNSILSFYAKLGTLNDALKTVDSSARLTQVSWNALIDAYMRAGDVCKASETFQSVVEKNIVSWTCMIAGYSRNGYAEEALWFFMGMMRHQFIPDDFTFGAVLHACSYLAVLKYGETVHGCVIRHGFCSYVYVGNGLINMYAKCGHLEGSILAFDHIMEKDLVSYNALLFAFGMHGKVNQAIKLYEDMIVSGISPDEVTFLGLLVTCSHSGLIEQGYRFFDTMRTVYGLSGDIDHWICMIDMLGRGGHIAEARDLVRRYVVAGESKASTYEVLLGACSTHGEVNIGTEMGMVLKALEPQKEMSYVLQSNLYCASGRWKEAENIRRTMIKEGVKKNPGCSWIEVRNGVRSFVARNHSDYYEMEELCKTLCLLDVEIRSSCLVDLEK